MAEESAPTEVVGTLRSAEPAPGEHASVRLVSSQIVSNESRPPRSQPRIEVLARPPSPRSNHPEGEPSEPCVGRILGRYQLVRKLGQGGMGAVYEAVHQELRKRAAIKVLHPQFAADSGVRARFLREGQAASRVRHANVVDVYDVAVEDAEPYLVMELLEGESLAQLLNRSSSLRAEQIVDIVVPIVAALATAHDLGVIHRDLKPENVFLGQSRAGTVPKVLDFGISKVVDAEAAQRLTGSVALLGTPCYMSPEQAKNARKTDFRSDIYSIGVLLYEGLTGTRPFLNDALYALLNAIVAGEFIRPSRLEPSLSPALEAVVLRAMAKHPEDRYPNARALGRDLLPFASERTRLMYAMELVDAPSDVAVVDLSAVGESGAVSPRGGAVAGLTPALPATQSQGSSTVTASARRSSGWKGASLGTAVGLVGLGAGLYFGNRAAPATGELGTAISAEAAPPGLYSTAEKGQAVGVSPRTSNSLATGGGVSGPATVRKRVESEPTQASVWVGDRFRCQTPCVLEMGPEEISLPIRAELQGRATVQHTLQRGDAEIIHLALPKVTGSAHVGVDHSPAVSAVAAMRAPGDRSFVVAAPPASSASIPRPPRPAVPSPTKNDPPRPPPLLAPR